MGVDGAAVLNTHIQHLGEKIDHVEFTARGGADFHVHVQRELEFRRVNEKVMRGEFAGRTDPSYRLATTENDFAARPLLPHRSPLRTPPESGGGGGGYSRYRGEEKVKEGWR